MRTNNNSVIVTLCHKRHLARAHNKHDSDIITAASSKKRGRPSETLQLNLKYDP